MVGGLVWILDEEVREELMDIFNKLEEVMKEVEDVKFLVVVVRDEFRMIEELFE